MGGQVVITRMTNGIDTSLSLGFPAKQAGIKSRIWAHED